MMLGMSYAQFNTFFSFTKMIIHAIFPVLFFNINLDVHEVKIKSI